MGYMGDIYGFLCFFFLGEGKFLLCKEKLVLVLFEREWPQCGLSSCPGVGVAAGLSGVAREMSVCVAISTLCQSYSSSYAHWQSWSCPFRCRSSGSAPGRGLAGCEQFQCRWSMS